MAQRQFRTVPVRLSHNVRPEVADVLEPVRDIVQHRFQGTNLLERAPTFQQLIDLGLVTESDVNNLEA